MKYFFKPQVWGLADAPEKQSPPQSPSRGTHGCSRTKPPLIPPSRGTRGYPRNNAPLNPPSRGTLGYPRNGKCGYPKWENFWVKVRKLDGLLAKWGKNTIFAVTEQINTLS